jgi:hypothetical protein
MFVAVQELKSASGFSYDDVQGCIDINDDVWDRWVKACPVV